MPERKGRKRRPGRERNRGGAAPAPVSTEAAVIEALQPRNGAPKAAGRSKQDEGPLPSNFARATGLMLALVTAMLAVVMVYQAATSHAGGIDQLGRIVAGVLLIALAIVVGVLSVVPGMVRDFFQRRR